MTAADPALDPRIAGLSDAKRALLEQRLRERAAARGETPVAPAENAAADDDDEVVLSFAQERLWLIERLTPGASVYNATRVVRVLGVPDESRLRAALAAVLARHDVLRTRISADPAGRLVAARAEPGPPQLEVVALPDAEATAALRSFAARPFDLGSDDLLRALLIRTGDGTSLLALSLHHIASDEGSRGLLWADLAAAYAGASLPPPRIRYSEIARLQRAEFARPEAAAELEWWRRHLGDAPRTLDLPADHRRPAQPSFRGGRHRLRLDPALVDALRRVAAAHGTTLLVVATAAVSWLISRLSGCTDVVLGMPVSGRERPESEGVVGLFVNTVVLRVDCSGEPSFGELVDRTRAELLLALEHQQVPFEKVVEALAPERDVSRNPLFQVLVNGVTGEQNGPLRLGELAAEPIDFDPGTTKFDLGLVVAEQPSGAVDLVAEYSADLFEDRTAARLLERCGTLLAAASADPDGPASALPVMTAGERDELLRQGTRLAAPPASTALDLIQAAVAAAPAAGAVAEATGSGRLTYAELWERSGAVAASIAARTPPGSLVGISVGRHAGLVVAALAVWRAGCAYVPIDLGYPPQRVAHMIADSGAAFVLGDDELAEFLAEGRRPAPSELPPVPVDSLAYVIYTSGSTGRPKGVAVEHGSLANLLLSMAREPGMSAGERLLALTTFSFDIAALELFLPLIRGGTLVIAGRDVATDPSLLAAPLRGVDVVQATPSTFRMLTETGWPGEPRLRVLCGGEQLPPDLAGALLPVVGELWNCYGPTETTIWSTVERVRSADDVTIGRPIANTVTYVLDGDGRLVPPGVQGELWIGGAGVARGYLGRPGLTEQRFRPDPWHPGLRIYRTGDVAVWTPDGRLRCLGRTDDQVKLRGHRIELGEIEAAMAALPEVRRAVAVLREDARGDPRIVGYVVGSPDGVLDALRATLPSWMIPSALVELDALPLTPNGKVDRAALPAAGHRAGPRTAPSTPAERVLAEVWAELLGYADPSVEDDFFAVGGHSLLAVRLSARLSAALGREVPLRAVFEHPTLGALAATLGAPDDAGRSGPVPVPRAGRRVAPRDAGDREALTAALAGRSSATDGPVVFPMTSLQQRMWLLQQMAPEDASYNVAVLRSVTGRLDAARLARALTAVVSRLEILRTRYAQVDELLVQLVDDEAAPEFAEHDLRGHAQAMETAQDLAGQLSARPFRLTEGPVLRCALLRVAEEEYLLLLCLHHIAIDAWSIDRLLEELAAAYVGVEADPVPLQFGDYALWEAQRPPDPDARDHWHRQLAGAPAESSLPLSRPRGAADRAAGRRLRRSLDESVAAGVGELASATGATPFMVLCAAVTTLLARHAGSDDVVVGTPFATRAFGGSESLIGALINTLALRLRVDPAGSFRDLVRHAKDVCVAAYRYSDYPFDVLIGELDVDRDPRRHPLFQVFIAMQEGRPDTVPFADAELRAVDIDRQRARFDLSFAFSTTAGRLDLGVEYRTDVFDDATAGAVVDGFEQLLRTLLDRPDVPLGTVPLATEADRATLARWNDTAAEFPGGCLHERIAAQAARTPDAPAVGDDSGWIPYRELAARANRLAHHLVELGVRPDDRVAICLDRGIDLEVALLGVLAAGGAYLPLDPEYPADRLTFLLEDSGAVALLTSAALRDALPAHPATVLVDDAAAFAEYPDTAPATAVGPENLAYVLYTSGTTGRPKGVAVEHRSIVGHLDWLQRTFSLGSDDAMLHKTPFTFDASMYELLWVPMTGARLFMARPGAHRDSDYLIETVRKARVTVLFLVPSMLRAVVSTPGAGECTSLRVLIAGGETLPDEVKDACLTVLPGTELHNFYGPTETTVAVSTDRCLPGVAVTIGRPVANTRLLVVDPEGNEQPIGVPGELEVAGIQVARGYLGRPELTAERFGHREGERIYRTGDLAAWQPDGRIRLLGRRDGQVKIRGHRIELDEVVAVLRGLPGVTDADALARDGELVGFVVPEDPGRWDPAALRREMRGVAPAHLVPAALHAVPALPRLPNGKVDRTALTALATVPAPQRGTDPPSGPAEELVAELWKSLLGLPAVGADDDFFDLGGDSLSASRFVAQLRAMDVDLPLMTVFTHPTVRALGEPVAQLLLEGLDAGGSRG